MNPGDRVVMDEREAFSCPFCGRSASYGRANGLFVVAHHLPTCRKFDELEGNDYLQACISEMAKKEPN